MYCNNGNKILVETEYIKNSLSEYLYVVPGDATYLLWIDCSKITNNSNYTLRYFIRVNTSLEEYSKVCDLFDWYLLFVK